MIISLVWLSAVAAAAKTKTPTNIVVLFMDDNGDMNPPATELLMFTRRMGGLRSAY